MCVCVCVFIKLHITTQSGPVILVMCVCASLCPHWSLIVPYRIQTKKGLSDGNVGEIWVTSKSRAAGYWSMPDKTKEDFGGRLADTAEVMD